MRTDPSTFDALSNFLMERGSPGVVIRKSEIQAYFASSGENGSIKEDVRCFLRGISEIHPEAETPRIRWRILKDRNWNSSWHRFFRPQKIGKAFWVTPPWATPPTLHRRQVITIEPGMAFGTGSHATTRACLEFLEKVAAKLSGKPMTALDIGTGSGILSIALAKLGAARIWAIDNDPVAFQVARENVRLNGAEKKVFLTGTALGRIRKSFMVVVANLTAETIIELAPALTKRVAARGFLILSGILNSQAERVIARIGEAGLAVIARKREKQWTSVLLRRK